MAILFFGVLFTLATTMDFSNDISENNFVLLNKHVLCPVLHYPCVVQS